MAGTEKTDKAIFDPPGDAERFRGLFMECPVSLWEEDIADLAAYLDGLRSSGIIDIRSHLAGHPDEVVKGAVLIKIVAVNKATLELYEAPDEKSLLAGLSAVFTEESLSAFREIVIALFEGRRQFEIEGINRSLRGKRLHVNLKWSLLPDSKGNLTRALVSVVDITERKRAEAALRESEEKFSKIFRQAPLLITLSDIKTGLFIDVNEKFLETSGFARGDVIGRTVLDIGWISEEQRSRMVQALRDQGRVSGMELSLRRKNGKKVICLFNGETISVSGEQRLLSIAQDITERKQAEEVLRENQARLDLALQSAHMGVWRWEIKENRRYFDDLTCQLLGIEASTFTGTSEEFFRAAHPEDREKIKAALARTIEQGVPYEPEYRVVWPDGSIHHITARGRLVRDDKGQPARINGILWDITEQRLLEEERLKTQKLESVGTLAGGIAHDFNNLLQGIFGYISMAKLSLDQREKALAMLEQAEEVLHQSVNLTTQLLTFSKGGKPVKKVIRLKPVIESAVRLALSGSRVDYLIDIDERLSPVEADEGQIGQVIQNIVLNADQAMPEGGRVKITARNTQAPGPDVPPTLGQGSYVKVSIRDSGIGIPEKYLPKIFDPYFTTKEKGSGLGLATSYSIVRNHGGVIDVRSEVARGSTFTIYLPATAMVAEQPAAARPAAMRPSRKGKVLVMDDEEVVRMVAGELIRELGHEAEFAEDGGAAVARYRTAMEAGNPFDVVILDLTIRGGMGGRETVQKLREIDPQVKAVVSSGYSDDDAVSEYRKYGFQAFLKKPYDIDKLRETLNALLA
jgi:PAS domain S-box-containing protein